jgi:uncharacterized RDD family membrane protein YckC
MRMDWFYVADQRQVGPVSEAEFARLVGLGAIRGETLVWRAGMKDWQPYGSFFPPQAPGAPQPGTSSASSSGTPEGAAGAGAAGAAAWTAAPPGAAAPGAATMSPVRPLDVPRYGGFWIRFLARIIDWLILIVINSAITMPLGLGGLSILSGSHDMFDLASMLALFGLAALIRVTVSATYEILLTWKKGATLGKLALGLKVVRPDGSGISLGRSVARFFSTWISGFIFCIGYIIAAFDDEKRSLHDRICETRVIRT